jgi:DNA-directed RNA polymerase subunit E'/Rpb7
MESDALFEQRVSLTSRDLNSLGAQRDGSPPKTVDDILLEKVRLELENKCSKHGFVLPDSVSILARSMGRVENGRFTGSYVYHVQAKGRVLTPADGYVVEGVVQKKNKMGMYVFHRNAFRIMVPRDLHLGSEEYESVQVGQTISVELKKSRFQMKDPYIVSVGVLRGVSAALEVPVTAAAAPVEAPEVTPEQTPANVSRMVAPRVPFSDLDIGVSESKDYSDEEENSTNPFA